MALFPESIDSIDIPIVVMPALGGHPVCQIPAVGVLPDGKTAGMTNPMDSGFRRNDVDNIYNKFNWL